MPVLGGLFIPSFQFRISANLARGRLLLPSEGGPESADIRRGAEILRLVLSYEDSIRKGSSRNEAVHRLARLNPKFSPEFFNALVALDPLAEEAESKSCRIEELEPGMIIQQEIQAVDGSLIISKGQEVTSTVISKLKNLQARRAISGSITISIPSATLCSPARASS